jgi:hypothetical protein
VRDKSSIDDSQCSEQDANVRTTPLGVWVGTVLGHLSGRYLCKSVQYGCFYIYTVSAKATLSPSCHCALTPTYDNFSPCSTHWLISIMMEVCTLYSYRTPGIEVEKEVVMNSEEGRRYTCDAGTIPTGSVRRPRWLCIEERVQ